MLEQPTPIFQQIVLIVEKRIRDGSYSPGDRLPAESKLAQEFGVSRGTIQNALSKLERKGIIMRRHGSGTFITSAVDDPNMLLGTIWDIKYLIELTGRKSSVEAVSMEIQPATVEDQETFRIGHDEEVIRTVRRYFADDTPVIVIYDRFPACNFSAPLDLADFNRHIRDILRDFCGEEIAYSNANIKAISANKEIADLLSISPGKPVLLMDDVIFNKTADFPVGRNHLYINTEEISLSQLRPWY